MHCFIENEIPHATIRPNVAKKQNKSPLDLAIDIGDNSIIDVVMLGMANADNKFMAP